MRVTLASLALAVALATPAYAAAPAPLTPARAVAWLEAHSELQAPRGASLPQVRLVRDPGTFRQGAKFGAYVDGTVYLASSLPSEQRDAVLLHELAHWMQPAGCSGAREMQAHTLTSAWMARTGRPGPRILWNKVKADAAACERI
jgi:hypothetical protein